MQHSVRCSALYSISLLAVVIFLASCTDPETHSLYDPGVVDKPTPSISSVSPPSSAVAGMDSVVLTGLNFSTVAGENTVYFNTEVATVGEATSTRMSMIAPLAVNDSVVIRVAVEGAIQFSNPVTYALLAGAAEFGNLAPATNLIPAELASSVTVNTTGDVYLGFVFGASDGGIISYTSDATRTDYAPATSGVLSWTGIRFGAGGYLYAARNFRAVYRFNPGGGAIASLWVVLPSGVRIADMDFDPDGMLWGGGEGTNIYRIASDKTLTPFPFTGTIRSVRVYNGYLYWAAATTDGERVWRAQISASGLGTPEVYYDLSTSFPGVTARSITFASDGGLVIGTDPPYGLIFVEPDMSTSTPYDAYADLFGTGLQSIAWGSSVYLYAATVEGDLLRILIRGRSGAVYHGN